MARQAAVVWQHGGLTQPLGKMVGHAFRQPPRVDKNECRAMGADQLRQAVVDLAPHLGAGNRAKFVPGHLHRHFHLAAVADRDDAPFASGELVAEEVGHFLHRLHRRRETDALQRALAVRDLLRVNQRLEPHQRQRQVRAALVIRHGMNLIDDDGPRSPQHAAALLGGKQNEQGLGGRYEDVGRPLGHPLPLPRFGVPGANGRANRGKRNALLGREGVDFGERCFEVLVNVVAKRLQRRNVDDGSLLGQRFLARAADERVEAD